MRLRMALQILVVSVCAFIVNAYAANFEPPGSSIPLDRLSAACKNAKAEFHPLDQNDVAQAKTALLEALGRLDQRLASAGAGGDAWREYLHWNALQESLRGAKQPDVALLNRLHSYYTADCEGLELVWFLDVQHALYNYMLTIGAVNDPQVRPAADQVLDKLAASLDAYRAKPTTENALVIGEALRWLQGAHQAPQLVEAIQQHFSSPNVIGEISAELVAVGIVEPVDDVTQVSDCILGTSICGAAHTVGKTSISLPPDANMGVIDTLFFGTATSDSVGCHGPVTIFSNSTTSLAACKRLWVSEEGFFSHPSNANAETSISINDIQSNKGRGLIERFAWRRAGKQQSQAESIASRHAEQRLNERIDNQVAESLEKANKQYIEKYKQPFSERKLFPQLLRFSTTARAISLIALQAGCGELAAPGLPPPVVDGADMTLRLHESAVNNLAFDALAGRTIHEEKMQKTVTDALGHLPEKMKGDEDGEPWAITFAPDKPISVSFADDGFKITLRGARYHKGNRTSKDMNISVVYKIEKSSTGFKAVRQGPIVVLPPGFVPGSGEKIDAQRTVIRKLLEKRFAKVFEPEILGAGLELSGRWKAAGKLLPIQVTSRDGWLVIAWKRASAM
jgi:hypothetical protein